MKVLPSEAETIFPMFYLRKARSAFGSIYSCPEDEEERERYPQKTEKERS